MEHRIIDLRDPDDYIPFSEYAKRMEEIKTQRKSDNKDKIHNIVNSIVLLEPMTQLRNEFMVSIRGYLRMDKHDAQLMARAEKAARKAIEDVLLEDMAKTKQYD